MKFKNCLVWAIKAKYFHTVLKLINVERLFQNNGSVLYPALHNKDDFGEPRIKEYNA